MDCFASETSILTFLPVASLAIALGGLVVRFFIPEGPARQTAVAASLVFIVLTSAIAWEQVRCRKQEIDLSAEDIVRILGNRKLTYEQILSNTRKPAYFKINAAIESLIQHQQIGTELVSITDRDTGIAYQITLFFVRTPQ